MSSSREGVLLRGGAARQATPYRDVVPAPRAAGTPQPGATSEPAPQPAPTSQLATALASAPAPPRRAAPTARAPQPAPTPQLATALASAAAARPAPPDAAPPQEVPDR